VDLWEVQVKPRQGRGNCWAVLPDGSQCPRERRTLVPYDGPGSKDGKIALCHGHRGHFLKYGSPRTDIPIRLMSSLTFEERVEVYLNPAFGHVKFGDIVRDDGTVCILWQGFTQNGGYGAVNSKIIAERVGTIRNALTHRMVWVYNNGPIPEGLQVHHNCHEKRCCNIRHLELTTADANSLEASTHSVVVHQLKQEIKALKEEIDELHRR